jgi:hypothetical protein
VSPTQIVDTHAEALINHRRVSIDCLSARDNSEATLREVRVVLEGQLVGRGGSGVLKPTRDLWSDLPAVALVGAGLAITVNEGDAHGPVVERWNVTLDEPSATTTEGPSQ